MLGKTRPAFSELEQEKEGGGRRLQIQAKINGRKLCFDPL